MNTEPQTPDGAQVIANAYNLAASPDFWVYKTRLAEAEVFDVVVWTELISRSVGERDTFLIMLRPGYLDPSKTSIRQSLLDIFSGAGGAGSRGALNTASRRKATRLEKLFAVASSAPPTPSGALGSTTAVATMGVHGPLTYQDVLQARELP